MTNWRTVYSKNKPEELDTTSSPTTVFERRNIEEVEPINDVDNKMYKYEERTWTQEEYSISQAVANTVSLKHESDIIDNYTNQLIKEGVI